MDGSTLILKNLGAILSFMGALVGVGGIIGYWIKSRIDRQEKDKERKKQYRFESIKEQHDLLTEFLGVPKSNFLSLHNIGNTWDEGWRKQRADLISEWVDKYHPTFPEDLRPSLMWIRNMANTMISNEGMKFMQRPEGFDKAHEHWKRIEDYKDKLERELTQG